MTSFFSCDSSKIRNAKWTHHFLWAVYTGHSELILCRWRDGRGECGVLLCGLWPVFGWHGRSGQWYRSTGRSSRTCDGSGSHSLSRRHWDGCGGGTWRAVAGRGLTFSLHTTSHGRLRYAGVPVASEAAGAAASVLSTLWVGARSRSELYETLLSICLAGLWCVHW